MIARVAGRAAATSFPLLDVFWTMLWIVLFSIWVCLVIMIFYDIFRSRDLAGWGKALWTLVVIIVPLVGVLIYLIARGNGMEERRMQAAQGDGGLRPLRDSGSPPGNADGLTAPVRQADRGSLRP